ncbi:hypothetical protein [Clostridium cylindrosporum]|uniref:Glucose / sorbosone dehydrogenase n=1 Tax=Clostridium cylindrosporum DSM 605 TaxID=1121307 RepID=A0A0J8DA35_CLOCY|nr:hypothetical protein [Clostridium cylindrosporum]KMT22712.1 glucose / sorbosone dehydrogenase [Clostridium cylindrosporum DSM 605]
MKRVKSLIGIGISVLICILTLNLLNISFYKKDNNEKVKVLKGYKSSVAVKGLKNPSSICFDESGNMYIGENEGSKGKVSIYTTKGEYREIIKGLNSPIGYVKMEKGVLYISHKGKVSKYKDGKLTDVVNNLPSHGDYSNNGVSIGYDEMIYIAQGSATNSGVVGLDNYERGWLRDNPYLHDIPSTEMVLKGNNFKTLNPFTEDKNDVASTNGFLPFNTPARINDHVKGSEISNASIIRANKDGSYVEMFAFGIRNPKNMINLSDGSVLVTVQGMENRGSRPIANGKDYIYKLGKGEYAGWPDFEGGEEVTNRKFRVEGKNQPLPLTYYVKGEVAKPLITFGESGRIGYMDISKDEDFGFKGQLLVPFAKGGKEAAKILVVNPKDKSTQELIVNVNGGETLKNPSQCIFSPIGGLYILESTNGTVLKIDKEKAVNEGILPTSVPIEYVILSGTIILSLVILIFIKMGKNNSEKEKQQK